VGCKDCEYPIPNPNRWKWLKRDFILGLVSGDEREARDRYGRYIGGRDGVVSEGSLWGNGRFYVFGF